MRACALLPSIAQPFVGARRMGVAESEFCDISEQLAHRTLVPDAQTMARTHNTVHVTLRSKICKTLRPGHIAMATLDND
jgi:hypothetical protein